MCYLDRTFHVLPTFPRTKVDGHFMLELESPRFSTPEIVWEGLEREKIASPLGSGSINNSAFSARFSHHL